MSFIVLSFSLPMIEIYNYDFVPAVSSTLFCGCDLRYNCMYYREPFYIGLAKWTKVICFLLEDFTSVWCADLKIFTEVNLLIPEHEMLVVEHFLRSC